MSFFITKTIAKKEFLILNPDDGIVLPEGLFP